MSNSLEYVEDSDGNKAYLDYFGGEEAAKKALGSLVGCENCVNCSDCSCCLDCSDCSYCSDCTCCSDCSDCSDCTYCFRCIRCSRCSRCFGCIGCSYCSGLSGCSDCSDRSPLLWVDEKMSVPIINDIDRVVYEAVSAPGNKLDMSDWHTCGTTHCRAGWVVHLAGEEGKKLESFFNAELAAMLIYRESGSPINPARFYDNNEEAMADIKARAGINTDGELK
jgi:hypothetical protein